IIKRADLGVLGNIDEHRTRTTASRYIKRFGEYFRNFFWFGDLIIPFGHPHGTTDHIRFLKGIRSQKSAMDLSQKPEQRSGIQPRVRQTGDQSGRTRTGGHETRAGFAQYAGVPSCGVNASLLVTRQDMSQLIHIVKQSVIYGHDGSSRVSEYGIDS